MKLVELSCPNCGAKLELSDESKNVSCTFCGTKLLVDSEAKYIRIADAEKIGYEFEKGRQKAKAELKISVDTKKPFESRKIKNKAKFLGPFYCILAAVVWGLSFVAQSEGASIGTFTFNGLRTLLGGIVLLPLVLFRFKKENSALPVTEKKKFPIKDVIIGGICCGIPLFIGGNLQQHAFNYLYVGKVGFITALYMVIVPLFGIFLKRKLKINIWAGVALGVVGLYFLSIKPGDFTVGTGELVTILCSFAFAAHILVIDHFCQKVDSMALSCAQFFFAGIVSVICMFIFEEPKIDEIISAWLPLVYAGVFSCGVAFTAQIFGQRYTNPTIASVLLCLESVFSVIFGWLILDQKLDARGYTGCVIMFAAVILTQLPQEWFDFKKKKG